MKYVRKFEKTGSQLRMRLYFDGRYVASFAATFYHNYVISINCEVINELYCNAYTLQYAMQHFMQAVTRCFGDINSAMKLFPSESDLLI